MKDNICFHPLELLDGFGVNQQNRTVQPCAVSHCLKCIHDATRCEVCAAGYLLLSDRFVCGANSTESPVPPVSPNNTAVPQKPNETAAAKVTQQPVIKQMHNVTVFDIFDHSVHICFEEDPQLDASRLIAKVSHQDRLLDYHTTTVVNQCVVLTLVHPRQTSTGPMRVTLSHRDAVDADGRFSPVDYFIEEVQFVDEDPLRLLTAAWLPLVLASKVVGVLCSFWLDGTSFLTSMMVEENIATLSTYLLQAGETPVSVRQSLRKLHHYASFMPWANSSPASLQAFDYSRGNYLKFRDSFRQSVYFENRFDMGLLHNRFAALVCLACYSMLVLVSSCIHRCSCFKKTVAASSLSFPNKQKIQYRSTKEIHHEVFLGMAAKPKPDSPVESKQACRKLSRCSAAVFEAVCRRVDGWWLMFRLLSHQRDLMVFSLVSLAFTRPSFVLVLSSLLAALHIFVTLVWIGFLFERLSKNPAASSRQTSRPLTPKSCLELLDENYRFCDRKVLQLLLGKSVKNVLMSSVVMLMESVPGAQSWTVLGIEVAALLHFRAFCWSGSETHCVRATVVVSLLDIGLAVSKLIICLKTLDQRVVQVRFGLAIGVLCSARTAVSMVAVLVACITTLLRRLKRPSEGRLASVTPKAAVFDLHKDQRSCKVPPLKKSLKQTGATDKSDLPIPELLIRKKKQPVNKILFSRFAFAKDIRVDPHELQKIFGTDEADDDRSIQKAASLQMSMDSPNDCNVVASQSGQSGQFNQKVLLNNFLTGGLLLRPSTKSSLRIPKHC